MQAADIRDETEAFVKTLVHLAGAPSGEWNGHVEATPRRVATMFAQLLTPEKFEFTVFDNTQKYDQVVLADGIRFYSLCAHHLMPFFGLASVAYIPNKKFVGLSKLPRTVKHFSHHLQVQEDMTQQIGDFIFEKLDPLGVAVIVRGRHLCMEMRGVEAPGTITTTSYLKGVFRENPVARAELFSLIKKEEPL